MAENSKIQWTTHTFNPWRGCSKVHTGCANCYAEATSKRNETILGTWGPNGTRVVSAERAWQEVLKWNKAAAKLSERPRVFCASLADVFEEWSGSIKSHNGETLLTVNGSEYFTEPSYPHSRNLTLDDVRRRLFGLIDATPNLDWLLLTKRPENVLRMWRTRNGELSKDVSIWSHRSNVWIGTSISDQETADKATPQLLGLVDLAPVRFLSAEPLVGPVELSKWFGVQTEGQWLNVVECGHARNRYGVNLVIVGGESGPGARPCSVEWVRDIVRQCAEANVACFVKQLGKVPTFADYDAAKEWPSGVYFDSPEDNEPDGPNVAILKDDKGGNPEEWPEDLRVRQMPERI